jgi:hypothetical protein
MAIILEVIAGVTTLGILFGYTATAAKTKTKSEAPPYGVFCLCYTTNKNTHIPWKTQIYKTENEYESATDEICKLALNPEKNFYLRERGFNGIALVNLDDGREEYWCSLTSI